MKALFALSKKERTSFMVLSFILFVYLGLGIYHAQKVTDFQDFYNAAGNFLNHEDLYHIESSKDLFGSLKTTNGSVDFMDIFKAENMAKLMEMKGKLGSYIYPPTFAFLLQPLALLTYEAAAIVFFLSGFLALLGIYYLFYTRGQSAEPFYHLLLVTISVFLFLESHMSNNQVGVILLFLILLSVNLKNNVLKALFFSLAIVIKLIPVAFGLYFLLLRSFSAFLDYAPLCYRS